MEVKLTAEVVATLRDVVKAVVTADISAQLDGLSDQEFTGIIKEALRGLKLGGE